MTVSVIGAIEPALNRTGRTLFKPFDLGKWFVLGFCAWLASLGEGGGSFNYGHSSGGGRGRAGAGQAGDVIEPALGWLAEYLWLVILLFVAGVALGLLLTWLRCRGQFMFLDGVVHNRGAVVEPWRRFRRHGNSLFGFRLVLGLVALGGLVAIAGVGLVIAWPDIAAKDFGAMAVVAIVAGTLLFVAWVIVLAIVEALLGDFVVPVMYLRDVRTVEAWRTFRREIVSGRCGQFVLFYLMKILLSMAVGIIALLATCLTCCIAALPYLGTVILLPLHVFMRCYSLYFLQQVGPEWRLLHDDPPAGLAPALTPPAPPPGDQSRPGPA